MLYNLVIYDGACVFCDNFINFLIKKSKANLKFIHLQDIVFKEEFKNLKKIDSIIVFTNNGEILYKYKAIKHLFKGTNLKTRILFFFVFIDIPIINDFMYSIFAKLRYRLFGKKEMCELPNRKIFYKSCIDIDKKIFNPKIVKCINFISE